MGISSVVDAWIGYGLLVVGALMLIVGVVGEYLHHRRFKRRTRRRK